MNTETKLSGLQTQMGSFAHLPNSIVLIFRGGFLGPRKRCGLETHTKYTAKCHLSKKLIILSQIFFIVEIYTQEY